MHRAQSLRVPEDPSPIEFFDRVGLMFIAVNKGLLISHSILEGVAQKKTRRESDRVPENWTPIVWKEGLLIFQLILEGFDQKKRLD